jgi:hypothetical protein
VCYWLRDVLGTGDYTTSVRDVRVEEILGDTAIVHVPYYNHQGMSGAGAVVFPEKDGRYSLVATYVGLGGEGAYLINPNRVNAYCRICEIGRVNGLTEYLNVKEQLVI